MKLLQEMLELTVEYNRVNGMDIIGRKLTEMRKILDTALNEGFLDDHRGDLEKEFDDIEKRYVAARRALATINRGGKHFTPDQTREHRSKIMRHINIFRNKLQNLMLDMNMSNREIEYHMDRIDSDRATGRPSEVFNRENIQRSNRPSRKRVNDRSNVGHQSDHVISARMA